MTTRRRAGTWHPPASPPAQVQDPAVRAILRIVSRSLKAITTVIDQRCGKDEADEDTPRHQLVDTYRSREWQSYRQPEPVM